MRKLVLFLVSLLFAAENAAAQVPDIGQKKDRPQLSLTDTVKNIDRGAETETKPEDEEDKGIFSFMNFSFSKKKKSKKVYRELVEKADDIGNDNPMAYNELFALAFVAPYVASEKKIPPETVQEMMRRSLYHIKWYFAKTDLNTDKGKAENKKSVVKYAKWYTPEKEAKYPTSFKVDFIGQPYEGACYYRITRCPICSYARNLGVSELMPLLCELDEVMITLQHGVLHRKQTLANGGEYCDYFITGDKERP